MNSNQEELSSSPSSPFFFNSLIYFQLGILKLVVAVFSFLQATWTLLFMFSYLSDFSLANQLEQVQPFMAKVFPDRKWPHLALWKKCSEMVW